MSLQPNSAGNYFVNVKVFEKLTGPASKSFSKCLFLDAKYVLNPILFTFYHIILIGQVSCKYFIQKIVMKIREDFGRIFGKIFFHVAPVGSFLKERALNKA